MHMLKSLMRQCARSGGFFPAGWIACLAISCSEAPAPAILQTVPEENLPARLASIEASEQQANETVWASEIDAQQHGAVFDALWDQINRSTNRWHTLGAFPFERLIPPVFDDSRPLGHGISEWESASAGDYLDSNGCRSSLQRFASQGWVLDQMEIRHIGFERGQGSDQAQSFFAVSGHLRRAGEQGRAVIEGELKVRWRRLTPQSAGVVASGQRERSNSEHPIGSGELSEWLSAAGVEWGIRGAPTGGAAGAEIS